MSTRMRLVLALLIASCGLFLAWLQYSRTAGSQHQEGIPQFAKFDPPPSVVATSTMELDTDLVRIGSEAGLSKLGERVAAVAGELITLHGRESDLAEAFKRHVGISLDGSFEDREQAQQRMGYPPTDTQHLEAIRRRWADTQSQFRNVRLFDSRHLEVRVVAVGRKSTMEKNPVGVAVRVQGRPPQSNPRLESLLDKGAEVIEIRLPFSAPMTGSDERHTALVGYRFVLDTAAGEWISHSIAVYMPYNNQRIFGLMF